MTDDLGTVVWEWNSDAFGEGFANEDPDSNLVDTTMNLRFPGQQYDEETATSYNYYRDYDPSIGSYIQSDPIGLQGGLNTYAYVNSNPLTFYDPYGLYSLSEFGMDASNFSAGFGDNITSVFGLFDKSLTGMVRESLGVNSEVDPCDRSYGAGEFSSNALVGASAALRVAARYGATKIGNKILNKNRYVRIGPGRMPARGSLPASPKAPRISIGKGPNNPHIDLRVRGID